ncbi:MAG TPA: signal peptidase I [Firmicutes bacterium]|nr:signal peptidase I [Bacillota bacterium]
MQEWQKPNAEHLSDEKAPGNREDRSAVAGLYEWVGAAIFSLTLVALVFAFLFRIVGVVGSSMVPTLHEGDRLIVTRLFYQPKQGDIVIINMHDEEPLVKRIIAVGGDRLRMDGEGGVYVNGEKLNEPYTQGITYPLGFGTEEQVVPEDCVFVMGDNREHSKDSRSTADVGFVKQSDIMGQAVLRIFPLTQAQVLH